jgi:hypothetical protein
MFCGTSSQIACGAWLLMSFSKGTVNVYGWIMSTFPLTSARILVATFLMIGYSISSR